MKFVDFFYVLILLYYGLLKFYFYFMKRVDVFFIMFRDLLFYLLFRGGIEGGERIYYLY